MFNRFKAAPKQGKWGKVHSVVLWKINDEKTCRECCCNSRHMAEGEVAVAQRRGRKLGAAGAYGTGLELS